MTKRATARAVAELAGVSRTTVSFVLNNLDGMRISEETRQRVLAAARRLDYHPDATARRMAAGQTHVIGFVLRQDPEQAFADHFLPQVLSGLGQAAAAQGYHVLFQTLPPKNKTNAYIHLIRERHVDGIVLSGPRFDDEAILALQAAGGPIVIMGQLPSVDIPFVDVDNVGGARLATEHLIRIGYRRIALITNAPLDYTASSDRLLGYRHALEAAGLPYDQSLVRFGQFTPQSGAAAMDELLDLAPRPAAVFVASDTVALGALQTLRRRGLSVPADIGLVGFDDIPLAEYVDPPLTTIRLPAHGLGWGAAEMLVRLIAGDEPIRNPQVLLETELVIRESCGAAQRALRA